MTVRPCTYLCTALITLLLWSTVFVSTPSANSPQPGFILTPNEKAWLAAHPVVQVRVSQSYPPFEFFDKGTFQGMSYDRLKLVEKRLGITFKPAPDMPWKDALASLKNRNGIDLVLMITHDKERESFIEFTKDYISFPEVIFTRKDSTFVSGIKDLFGRTIATENSFIESDYLKRDVPEVKIIETPTTAASLEAVATGKADAYIGNLAVASYLIEKMGLANLKVAAPSPYPEDAYCMGVRKDWPELAGLINKAMASISAEERLRIDQKWLSLRYEYGIQARDVIKWFLILAAGSLVVIVQQWYARSVLEKRVQERTRELQRAKEESEAYAQERSELLDAVKISQKLLDTIIGNSSHLLGILTPEGKLLDANRTSLEMIGASKDDVVGRDFWECPWWSHSPELQQLLRDAVMRAAAGEHVHLGAVHLDSSGSAHDVEFTIKPVFNQQGEVLYLIPEGTDITERMLAERALRESEEKYRLITQNVVDLIWMMDSTLHFIYANPSVERIHGWTAEEFLSLSINDVTTPESLKKSMALIDQNRKWRESVDSDDSGTEVVELELLRKDGSTFIAEVSASEIRDKDGRTIGIIGITRDITERIKLEQQVIQQQKLDGIGMLAGGVAHDINNLLTPIYFGLEMVERSIDPNHRALSRVRLVKNAASKITELVRQLLVFSRKQQIALEPLELNSIVSRFMDILRRTIRENIVIDLKLSTEPCHIRADRNQMEQVIMNLAVNAQDAIDGVGRITVETGHLVLDGEYCAHYPGTVPGNYVMLAFTDTGCGMDKKTLAKIFEPFFTTKPEGKGTGLGLSTVYGIVRQHGGHIDALSREGTGSTFRVFLPISSGAAMDTAEALPELPGELQFKGSLLLVEDNDLLRESLLEALQGHDIPVLSAASPQEALAIFTKHRDDIGILLTDVIMPEMSGPELYHILKGLKKELPVLFMSGYASDIGSYQEIVDNPSIFLTKPFTIQTLINKLARL